MANNRPRLSNLAWQRLRNGAVLCPHPLALTEDYRLDDRHQRALSRYYLDAGAGGLAVGVYQTQLAIRHPDHDLFHNVLEIAAEEMHQHEQKHPGKPIIKIAGIFGPTEQAIHEAQLAFDLGYDLGLLMDGHEMDASLSQLVERAEAIAEILPLIGYQPPLHRKPPIYPYAFWRRFCEITNVAAIVAAGPPHSTLNIVRAVVDSEREKTLALYTGNSQTALIDLITPYRFHRQQQLIEVRIVGSMLDDWCYWTHKAVEQHTATQRLNENREAPMQDYLLLNAQLDDCHAAIHDAENGYQGEIAGVLEILRRQGLVSNTVCLSQSSGLSEGQTVEIDRILSTYPHLSDIDFTTKRINRWLL